MMSDRVVTEAYSYRGDPGVPEFPDTKSIIVFDGDCVFCSGWIRFALWADRHHRYAFVAGQSELGRALYRHYGLDDRDFETNILISGGVARFKSAATIGMVAGFGFPWSVARVLSLIPRRIADVAYEVIARNRYRLGGRKKSCFIPAPEDRHRFIA